VSERNPLNCDLLYHMWLITP